MCKTAFRLSIITTMLLASTATYAGNSETYLWKDMGTWSVRVDKTFGNACYMVMTGVYGTQVRLGYDGPASSGKGYIILGNPSWRSIETDKKYKVTIQFDSEPIWTGTATGRWAGDLPILYMPYSNRQISMEFAERHYIKMWFGQTQVTNLSLQGSGPVMQELTNCQEAVDSNRPSRSDPFKNGV
jgi:hypothetical protein